MLHGMDDRYQPSSPDVISDNIIPGWHSCEEMKVKQKIKRNQYCGLTNDGWSSRAISPYITVTCYLKGDNLKLDMHENATKSDTL